MLLNCHTYYSFRYGTYSIKELLTDVYHKGYRTFALTDINNTSAVLETLRLTEGKAVKAVPGIDFRNTIAPCYVGLARNNEGFRELNQHLSDHLHSGNAFPEKAPAFNHAFIIYPLSIYKGWALQDHEFIGVSPADLKQLPFSPYKNSTAKMVVLHEVSFQGKRQFNAHRLLRAIDRNTLLSKLQANEQATGTETLMPRQTMMEWYAGYPQLIRNTEWMLESCLVSFEFGKLKSKNRRYYLDSTAADMELLRNECLKGLVYRYLGKEEQARAFVRMEKELDVIARMQFSSYFLINWDIIRYAKRRNYYHVGRGSGANSIVAYLVGITDVDPIELDLYFERFINENRSNAPDFDIDFSWTDRDDITRYIFDAFGQNNKAALLGTYSTFQKDAVTRELGKVFGLPPAEIDRLQAARSAKDVDTIGEKILLYSGLIQNFPSHLSIHASGIIISELPVQHYTATNLPPKGYATTQFSMLEAEDIGLYKFDILSQRGLGKIKDALSIIRQNRGVEIDIHNIRKFTADEDVKDLLRKGKAIGCFYVESPGMRMLLAKLQADDYLRLVAASSIIRPGVSKSGMMRAYIDRFRNTQLRTQARNKLPELYDLLAETYGVMVYQEDVIKVAHLFAGLTLADADYLRRGMSWKFKQRNEFYKVRERFFENCLGKGHALPLITEIWNQIESFANFAFSKGHSASYAVESYQALYLKAHYPLEYMVATLNNGGGFYRKELYVHEARMHGATICMPCMNNSRDETTIQGNRIYLGLGLISELTEHTRTLILDARSKHGPFADIADFVSRVPVSLEQVRLLIRAGTFTFTGIGKKELMWLVHTMISPATRAASEHSLFRQEPKSFTLPPLKESAVEDAFDEMELLGFTLEPPFHLLRDHIPSDLPARALHRHIGQEVTVTGYLVNTKSTQTANGQRMYFGTFIDTEGQWIDTVHFPDSAKQHPFTGNGCYVITGMVAEEYDFISITVTYLKRLPFIDRESIHTE